MDVSIIGEKDTSSTSEMDMDFSVISRSPFYFDYEEKKKTKNESVDFNRIARKLGCNKKCIEWSSVMETPKTLKKEKNKKADTSSDDFKLIKKTTKCF